MRYFMIVLCAAVALTALAGCGQRKGVVYGKVTLDGKPLDNGDIQFVPEAGDGQTAGGIIGADGSFRVANVSPTKMKVVVNSSKVVGHRRRMEEDPNSEMIEVREAAVPTKYLDREKTDLSITVVPGDNQKDFDLKSK
jgi:hypothetical protein